MHSKLPPMFWIQLGQGPDSTHINRATAACCNNSIVAHQVLVKVCRHTCVFFRSYPNIKRVISHPIFTGAQPTRPVTNFLGALSSSFIALSSSTSQFAHKYLPFKNSASGLATQLTNCPARSATAVVSRHQPRSVHALST